MATIAVSRSRPYVAAGLAVVSSTLLILSATVTLGFAGSPDAFAFVVVICAVLSAGSALAAVVAMSWAPKLSRILLLAALTGSVVAQPPLAGLFPGVPVFLLAIAAGLMYASPQESASSRASNPARDHPGWVLALAWLGLVLHVTVGLLYVVAAWVTPFFGPVLYLWGIWVGLWAALLLLACLLVRTRPIWTPVAPLVAVGLWFAVVSLQAALGWLP